MSNEQNAAVENAARADNAALDIVRKVRAVARAAPTRAKPIRRTVEDADEALRRLGDGDTIKFSQDGDDAWFTKGDKAFIGDAAIWSLRNRGLIVRKCDDEDNYRGMSEYDAISDVGRAYLAILDKDRPARPIVQPPSPHGLAESQARIDALEEALAAIKLLTSWSKKKTDHRLPVVKEAHELACAALAMGSN